MDTRLYGFREKTKKDKNIESLSQYHWNGYGDGFSFGCPKGLMCPDFFWIVQKLSVIDSKRRIFFIK